MEARARRRPARDRRAARAARPAGAAGDDFAGRDPQLLRAGIALQAGRAAGPLHQPGGSRRRAPACSRSCARNTVARAIRTCRAAWWCMPPEDYERWLAAGAPDRALARARLRAVSATRLQRLSRAGTHRCGRRTCAGCSAAPCGSQDGAPRGRRRDAICATAILLPSQRRRGRLSPTSCRRSKACSARTISSPIIAWLDGVRDELARVASAQAICAKASRCAPG